MGSTELEFDPHLTDLMSKTMLKDDTYSRLISTGTSSYIYKVFHPRIREVQSTLVVEECVCVCVGGCVLGGERMYTGVRKLNSESFFYASF